MEQLALNGDQKAGTSKPPGPSPAPSLPVDSGAKALAAVCWAAGALLAQVPAPVSSLRVRCGEVSVDMEWPAAPQASTELAGPAGPAEPAGSAATFAAEPDGQPAAPDLAYVRAPMVGTFYHASSPDTPPFVRPGDVVEAGQQVGIVEAMKLMNAVEADRPGRVVEIVVPNAAAVEFDQPLVAIASLEAGGPLEEELQCSPPY